MHLDQSNNYNLIQFMMALKGWAAPGNEAVEWQLEM